MSQTAVYVSPPPTAPLLHEPQLNLLPDSQTFTRQRAVSMFDRQLSSIVGTYAGADLRPLRMPNREKGRVTVKNAPWNWGGGSETHPHLLATPSRSVTGVWGHTSRPHPMEPQSAGEPRALHQEPLVQPLRRLPSGRHPPPPSQHVDERIFFNEEPSLSSTPSHPTHKRARSRTFTSADPISFAEPTNLKSRSETTLGKHKSKLTLHQFQLLVTESLEVEHDVDVEEDYRPQTRRGPPGFHMPTAHSPIQRPDPGFSESPIEPIDLVIPPAPRSPAPQPPSPASFYSASSSPHSDPGYDSDSASTIEAKVGDHGGGGGKDDTGFDSDDALSLPAFYRNPHASNSDETLGTIGSIGSIGTVGTMGTMDTISVALRSLGPAHRPTIRGIRSRVASVDKNGGVVMTERRPSNVGNGVVNGPRLMPKVKAEPMQAQVYPVVDDWREKEKHLDVKTKGVLRPKDRRSLETPSSLSLSMNLLGLPASQASPTTNVGARRPLSSAVAAHKALVGGHEDVPGSFPTKVNIPASSTQPPPRPPRRVHRVPPPLVLQPPAPSFKNLEAQLALTPKSSTSFRFPPPPTPLSPALSFMSSMSALSTVSTIAAVMLNRPKSKQPRISEKELRRRRFLKLTKTLGDDVPPELVSVKAAVPRRSRTISFGARGKFGGSRDQRGKRDSMVENGKGSGRMRKKRKDSFDGRRTAGARHSIAVSPLEANFPSIPEGYDRYDEPLAPISPNVLRKYPSIRRRSTSNPNGRPISETFSRASVNPTPVLSPEPGKQELPVVTPYFEDHPFRLVVEESSPTPAPTVPRFVDADGKAALTQTRKVTGSGPRVTTEAKERELDDGGRSSSYSMNNPWMRTSLALPLSYDTPFIEYALPCGVDRKVAEGRLGVGHHRRMSSLDAISPRRISALEPLTDDTQIQYRSSGDVGGDAADTFGGRFSAIGGLCRSNGTYLDVPQEVDGDDGEWENVENGIYRKERRQGWSGEWNQPHIQTVIEKLRQL